MSDAVVVIEVAPPTTVMVGGDSGSSVVAVETKSITVITVAEQGPPGPPGSGSGSAAYVHDQVTPSPTWTIPHNLGFMPDISLLSIGGMEIDGNVIHVSTSVAVASFVVPVAGTARCH